MTPAPKPLTNDMNAGLLPTQELLEPCPWCGRQPWLNHYTQEGGGTHWFSVECTAPPSQRYKDPTLCWGVSGPRKKTEAEAITAWNSRATPPMPAGVTEGVVQADRDAAAAFVEKRDNAARIDEYSTPSDVHAEYFASGEHDNEDIIQAMAAHRIAHATPPPEAEGWRGLTEKQIEDGARQLELVLTEPDYAGMYDTALITALEAMGLDPVFAEAAPLPASPVGDDEGGGR